MRILEAPAPVDEPPRRGSGFFERWISNDGPLQTSGTKGLSGTDLAVVLTAMRPGTARRAFRGTNASLRSGRAANRLADMKRLIAIPLWFYAGWTAGAFADFIASYAGLSIGPVLGPVLGTAAAALFVGDPRHMIWPAHRSSAGPMRSGTQQPA